MTWITHMKKSQRTRWIENKTDDDVTGKDTPEVGRTVTRWTVVERSRVYTKSEGRDGEDTIRYRPLRCVRPYYLFFPLRGYLFTKKKKNFPFGTLSKVCRKVDIGFTGIAPSFIGQRTSSSLFLFFLFSPPSQIYSSKTEEC